MFDWDEEWNISFAGCGFRSIYYLGALSCILERVPQLVLGASKICGASSGCLVAAALTVGIPIEQFCIDVLTTAKEARKHSLGVFHPTFSLLRTVRDSLLERLPEDAHLRASGKLCVSLTRMADGKNVLVSQFDSREELIQVLMCSCFFPVYCGYVPPSYRGVDNTRSAECVALLDFNSQDTWIVEQDGSLAEYITDGFSVSLAITTESCQLYMDGALSNNMPLFEQRNTITVAPFSGESDICPKDRTFNLEVHYGNVSILVNTNNVYRVYTSFLPTRPETLAEICHDGYMDALRFLSESDLLGTQCGPPTLVAEMDTRQPACCELAKVMFHAKEARLNGLNTPQEEHWWLELKTIENLPVSFKKVLCAACRDSHTGSRRWSQLTEFPPVKAVLCLLTPLTLAVELSILVVKSMVLSGWKLVCSLSTLAGDLCRQTRRSEKPTSVSAEQQAGRVQPELRNNKYPHPPTSQITSNGDLDLFSITSTCSSRPELSAADAPASGRVTLNHRSKWRERDS